MRFYQLLLIIASSAKGLLPSDSTNFRQNMIKVSKLSSTNILEEYSAETNEKLNTIHLDKHSTTNHVITQKIKSFSLYEILSLGKLLKIGQQTLLPVGYPRTVPAEYATFQIWNVIQDLSSYLRGILATKAVLEGMGVGRLGVTATQAAVQWIFRDGASMIGGLLFTSFTSYNFGQNVKLWRLFADIINNFGITLDMIAPLFPKYFLTILCVASICKALCGISAGAAGVSISEHWGEKNGNIADVNAKNSAQHTVVSLFGLAMSMYFAESVEESVVKLWSVYSFLTVVHVWSNYKAIRVLALRSINTARLNIVLDRFFSAPVLVDLLKRLESRDEESLLDEENNNIDMVLLQKELILWKENNRFLFTPTEVAKIEPILSLAVPDRLRFFESKISKVVRNYVKLWAAPSFVVHLFSEDKVKRTILDFQDENYFIILEEAENKNMKKPFIHICFSNTAGLKDHIKAIFEGFLLYHMRDSLKVRDLMSSLFPIFWDLVVESDWKIDNSLLQPQGAIVYGFK